MKSWQAACLAILLWMRQQQYLVVSSDPHLLASLKRCQVMGWCMIRHLSKNYSDGQLTSSWVNSDEFPTVYFPAMWVMQYLTVTICSQS